MTCIVGMSDSRFAVIAADSQVVDGWISHSTGAPKITRKDRWLFGTTGPIRVNNAIKHAFSPPVAPDVVSEQWIVTTFVPSLIEAMTKSNMAVVEGWLGGKEAEQQGTVLCVCPGAIFTIQADWAVDLWEGGFAAIGTGQRYSLAALYAATTVKRPDTVEDCVAYARIAVEAATRFDIYCGGRADTLSINERNSSDSEDSK